MNMHFLLTVSCLTFLLLNGCSRSVNPGAEDSPCCEETGRSEVVLWHDKIYDMLAAGKRETAGTQLKELLTRYPRFPGAYRTLAAFFNDPATLEWLNTRDTPEARGYTLWAVGLLRQGQQDYNAAGDYFRQAIALLPEAYAPCDSLVDICLTREEIPGPEGFLRGLMKEGHSSAPAGLAYYYLVKKTHEEALELLGEPEADSILPGRLLRHLGNHYSRQNLTGKALCFYTCALVRARAEGDKNTECAALINLGMTSAQLSDYREARDKFTRALPLAKVLGQKNWETIALIYSGIAYRQLHQYPEALDVSQKGWEASRQLEGGAGAYYQILATNSLGQLYEALSSLELALDYYNTALRLAEEGGSPSLSLAATARHNAGYVLQLQGKYSEARLSYTRVLELFRELALPQEESVALNNLGETFLAEGDYARARSYLQDALELRRRLENPRGEGITLGNLGECALRLGDAALAMDFFTSAYRLLKGSPEEAVILGKQGLAAYALGKQSRAKDFLLQSANMLDAIAGGLHYHKHISGFMQDKQEIYNTLITLFYELNLTDPGGEHLLQSFRYSEKARARALLDLQVQGAAGAQKNLPAELINRRTEIDREYAGIHTLLQQEQGKGNSVKKRATALADRLEELEHAYEEVQVALANSNPAYANLISGEPPSPAQLQAAALNEDTLLVEYKLAGEAVFAWSLGRGDLRLHKLEITADLLDEKVLRLYTSLRNPATGDEYLSYARELYGILLQPVLATEQDYTRLIIIPDGKLHYLPFAALVPRKNQDGSPVFLNSLYTLHYIQSATVLYQLTRGSTPGQPSSSPVARALLAFGNPRFSWTSDAGGEQTFHRSGFAQLPGSSAEVQGIGDFFERKTIYMGAEAREEILKTTGGLLNFSHLHFSTHSEIDEKNPAATGLVFAQDDDPAEDGFLQVREIFNLETRAQLVVLSACRTALGGYVKGEGLVGLIQAWMYAGSPAVVVSLWTVADEAAALFMQEFYRTEAGGLSVAAALQSTRTWMHSQEGFTHPYYWAPFVLVGRN